MCRLTRPRGCRKWRVWRSSLGPATRRLERSSFRPEPARSSGSLCRAALRLRLLDWRGASAGTTRAGREPPSIFRASQTSGDRLSNRKHRGGWGKSQGWLMIWEGSIGRLVTSPIVSHVRNVRTEVREELSRAIPNAKRRQGD